MRTHNKSLILPFFFNEYTVHFQKNYVIEEPYPIGNALHSLPSHVRTVGP